MALTFEEVKKVATLARLQLSDSEIEEQSKHFNSLLLQFDQLLELDVTDIEPTSHSNRLVNVMREDRITPSLTQEQVLANAPDSQNGQILTPKIVDS